MGITGDDTARTPHLPAARCRRHPAAATPGVRTTRPGRAIPEMTGRLPEPIMCPTRRIPPRGQSRPQRHTPRRPPPCRRDAPRRGRPCAVACRRGRRRGCTSSPCPPVRSPGGRAGRSPCDTGPGWRARTSSGTHDLIAVAGKGIPEGALVTDTRRHPDRGVAHARRPSDPGARRRPRPRPGRGVGRTARRRRGRGRDAPPRLPARNVGGGRGSGKDGELLPQAGAERPGRSTAPQPPATRRPPAGSSQSRLQPRPRPARSPSAARDQPARRPRPAGHAAP